MKLRITCLLVGLFLAQWSLAQQQKWANPIIENYGKILDLNKVDMKPDPNLEYKIVIELVHKMDKPKRLNFSAKNVARLINLHAIGGVKPENLKVAVVVHAQATNSVLDEKAYQKKYKVQSPYLDFYKELTEAGVEVVVCGQSLNMFAHKPKDVMDNVQIATSALTAVSTYQLKGYAYFKWD